MKKLPYFWQSWSWLKKRDQGHLTFTTVYCYNFSILLLIVVNLLPCLIYKLNIITGNKCKGKKNIYPVLYYPSFQASTGGLGTYAQWIREDHCTWIYKSWVLLWHEAISYGSKLCKPWHSWHRVNLWATLDIFNIRSLHYISFKVLTFLWN